MLGFPRVPDSVLAVLAMGTPAFLIAARTDATIDAHRARQEELVNQQTVILAKADDEKRDLSVEEQESLRGLNAEYDRLDEQVALREKAIAQAEALAAPRGRKTDDDAQTVQNGENPVRPAQNAADRQPARTVVVDRPRVAKDGMAGFRNFGDFAQSVKNANPKFGGETDKRLLIHNASASTYGNETVGSEGGFLVPPDMRAEISSKVFGEDSLVSRTDRQRTSSNTITLPTDMTTPWQTSGGVLGYWTNEAAAITQSKPAFENVTLKAQKLAVLVPVTEELVEDSPALDGYLRRKAPEKMDFMISNSLIRGTGAGQPLGIVNSPAIVTVAKENAQTADTINATNVLKMFSRMPITSRNSAIWLIHPDAEVQLPLMTIGNMPVYVPPGGLSGSQYGTLLGRPVIPHQVCETVGDLGDIFFVDFQQYLSLTKTGGGRDANGYKADVSMHLWFDQDLVAYKFTLRIGGQPWWSTYTTPRDGTSYMSPYIQLEAR